MKFAAPLKPATLVRRYKRFLADVKLENDSLLTLHCPNSGSMKTCSEPGSQVLYSTSANPRRRYPHTLEMVQCGTTWVGINTSRTNDIVCEAIRAGTIRELTPFDSLTREVKTSADSRLDLKLTSGTAQQFVEIKNCTYVERGRALFPDAVTARGTKHLLELARLVQLGHRGIIVFLVQRLDAQGFSPAADIDERYAKTLAAVARQGVELLAYQAAVTPESITIVNRLPISFHE